MLQLLLASGFFTVNETVEDWTRQEEKDAFLATSKHNFARILAKELWNIRKINTMLPEYWDKVIDKIIASIF